MAADRLHFLALPDTAAPHDGVEFGHAVDRLAAIIGPGEATLLAPWAHDPHCDHLATHLMAVELAERLHCRHLAYPVWGWTLPAETELGEIAIAGFRVPVPDMALKRRAIGAHLSQTTRLIDDDPDGFLLDATILDAMLSPYEVFLTTP